MQADEARALATKIEPHDEAQRAITEATLREVGEGVVTVQRAEPEQPDPAWQVFRNGAPLSFAGLFIYGGATRDEAVEEARRVASKWDWTVVA